MTGSLRMWLRLTGSTAQLFRSPSWSQARWCAGASSRPIAAAQSHAILSSEIRSIPRNTSEPRQPTPQWCPACPCWSGSSGIRGPPTTAPGRGRRVSTLANSTITFSVECAAVHLPVSRRRATSSTLIPITISVSTPIRIRCAPRNSI